MPRKGKGRKRPLNVLIGENTLSLGTLGADTLLGAPLTTGSVNLGENYFIYSVDIIMALRGATPTEGPIWVGIAHADYSDAQIEAWLETSGGFSPKNLQEREVQKRLVRKIGAFEMAQATEDINDGLPIRVKLNWMLPEGQPGLKIWVFNTDTSALTTGAILAHTSTWYGRWVF